MATRPPPDLDESAISATHHVTFSGCPSGVHPLTWAQMAEIETWERLPADEYANSNARSATPLVGIDDVAQVLPAVRTVVMRHEALRTALRRDEQGGWTQQIASAGQVPVQEFPAETGVSQLFVRQVLELLAVEPFTFDDPPVRVAVITVDRRPVAVGVALPHLVADGLAAEVVCREIRLFCEDPRAGEPLARQPREIAAQERGPWGRRQADRADAYLKGQLRNAAPVPLPRVPDPGEDLTFFSTVLNSRAVAAASVLLSARLGVSQATVVLTGYALALCGWLGQTSVTATLACHNRDHPQMRGSVANLAQHVPVTLDTGSGDFAKVCRTIADAVLPAYRYCRHDPVRHRQIVADVEREKGSPVRISFSVNLRAIGPPGLGVELDAEARTRLDRYPGLSGGQLRDLLQESEVREFSGPHDRPFETIDFTLWVLTDVAGMMLLADNRSTTAEVPGMLLKALESVLVDAACDVSER